MIAPTAQRVVIHTSDEVNRRIHSQTERRLRYFAKHTDQISARLREFNSWERIDSCRLFS